MKKELLIFILLFVFLALGMHMNQWLVHPMQHLHNLTTHKMPYHPLLYTFILYCVLGFLRVIVYTLKKIFQKS